MGYSNHARVAIDRLGRLFCGLTLLRLTLLERGFATTGLFLAADRRRLGCSSGTPALCMPAPQAEVLTFDGSWKGLRCAAETVDREVRIETKGFGHYGFASSSASYALSGKMYKTYRGC